MDEDLIKNIKNLNALYNYQLYYSIIIPIFAPDKTNNV
jgi:hypothetical protein